MARPYDKFEIERRLQLACQLADKARGISLPAFERAQAYSDKNAADAGDVFDPVTKTDRAVESLLRTHILKHVPDDGIIGEEFGRVAGQSAWSWCIDPIDGTRAFIAGVPVWSLLIAICYQAEPLIGIIDLPALGERYIGAPDTAWYEDKAGTHDLGTKPCARLDQAILSCTEPMAMFSRAQKAAYEKIRRRVRFTRLGLDAYAYALLARGRVDIILEAGLAPYDVQAHIPIIKAAGGVLTSWHGGSAQDGGAVVCVGDGDVLKDIHPLLATAL